MPSSHSGLPLFLMFPRYATILRAFIYPECSSADILSSLLGRLQIFAQKSPQWDSLFTIFKFYFQLSPQIPISFTALFLLPLVTCIVISLTFYLVSLLSTCPFPMFNLLLYKEASGWSFVYLFSHVLFCMSYKFLIHIIFLLPKELLKNISCRAGFIWESSFLFHFWRITSMDIKIPGRLFLSFNTVNISLYSLLVWFLTRRLL